MARVRISRMRWGIPWCLALALVACNGRETASETDTRSDETTTTTGGGVNDTDPQWVYRDPQKPNKVAVVFVHGIFGDTKGTWTHDNGTSFFDYLHEAPGVGDKVDIYAFGFTSKMIGAGSLKIGEAAVKLNDYLVADGVDKYDQIVFVGHSMGGLITMRELVSRQSIRDKVPLLVFYATPHEGSQITNIAKYVVNNEAVRQMFPVDANDYLQQLNEDWVTVRNGSPRPTMICAYEKKAIGPVLVVPWASSTRNCDEIGSAIEDSDHMTIVKPNRARHPSVIVLVNALNKYVMPSLDDENTAWDTPNLRKDPEPWTYVIENAGKRNTVVFENRTAVPLRYSLAVDDQTFMLALPKDMPRTVAPGARDAVDLVLLNPLRNEYRLKLQLGSSPERIVVARIPDMAAAIAQRNELDVGTAQRINTFLATGDNEARFKALPAEQQHETLVTLANEAVASQQPGLPPEAQLVLTADTLTSLNLSNSAAVALGSVEQKYPETAKAASVRRLAGVVSTRTGKTDVLEAGVPRVPEAEATKPVDLSTTTEAQRRELSTLADRLRTVPATEAEASVLKGDVLRASGDQAAAARVYTEASTVEATPVVRDRLRRASQLQP